MADSGQAVQLTNDRGRTFRIALVRGAMPRRDGTAILYQCPRCGNAPRNLYTHAVAFGRPVESAGWQCQSCARLRWNSQGRYVAAGERAIFTASAEEYGLARYREPFPRHPWDPRAVSDPELIRAGLPTLFRCKTPSTPKRVPAGFPRQRPPIKPDRELLSRRTKGR